MIEPNSNGVGPGEFSIRHSIRTRIAARTRAPTPVARSSVARGERRPARARRDIRLAPRKSVCIVDYRGSLSTIERSDARWLARKAGAIVRQVVGVEDVRRASEASATIAAGRMRVFRFFGDEANALAQRLFIGASGTIHIDLC